MFFRTLRTLVPVAAFAFASTAFAAADPSMHDVYETLQAGRVTDAQQMMQQVLRDHPGSGKAQYVAAEVDARAGDVARARQELATAESIDPGLPFAKAESVRELRRELSNPQNHARSVGAERSFPWGLTLIFGIVIAGILWVLFRRRAAPVAGYPTAPMSGAPGFGQPGYGQPGYGPAGYGGGPMGGGSGLLGNLASGMAVGAGVVAGEELVRHMMAPGHAAEHDPAAQQTFVDDPATNVDMGGNDFGVGDSGSWDDSGGSGGDWN